MSIVFLKVKVKSLADEAAVIRFEEKKYLDRRPGTIWWQLNYHRIVEVRKEARAAHLAYNFLRGTPYRDVEASYHDEPNWERVVQLVKKYGAPGQWTGVEAWRNIGHNSAAA